MWNSAGRRLPAPVIFCVIWTTGGSSLSSGSPPRQEKKQMDTIVPPGLVLKETRYKESDRIMTLLTPDLGVISASAKGSLRLKSKLFSACGLFCYSEFVLVPGRNMYTVREADVKNVFHGISSSIEGMSLAMYMAEMASALSPTGDEAEKYGKNTNVQISVEVKKAPSSYNTLVSKVSNLTYNRTEQNIQCG